MNVIKAKSWDDLPKGYTGIVEWESGNKGWYRNRKLHKEDGPAYIREDGVKFWHLDGFYIWDSTSERDFTNKIILSKTQHSKYSTIQIWKILGPNGLYELNVIPGMEEFIIE